MSKRMNPTVSETTRITRAEKENITKYELFVDVVEIDHFEMKKCQCISCKEQENSSKLCFFNTFFLSIKMKLLRNLGFFSEPPDYCC